MTFAIHDTTDCRDCPFPMGQATSAGAGPEVPFPLPREAMQKINLLSKGSEEKKQVGQAIRIVQLSTFRVDLPNFGLNPVNAVLAVGEFTSGGWTRAFISPRRYVQPPQDGIWDFDLVAERSLSPHTLILTYLASVQIWHFEEGDKGIRVYSSTSANEKISMFE